MSLQILFPKTSIWELGICVCCCISFYYLCVLLLLLCDAKEKFCLLSTITTTWFMKWLLKCMHFISFLYPSFLFRSFLNVMLLVVNSSYYCSSTITITTTTTTTTTTQAQAGLVGSTLCEPHPLTKFFRC